MLKKMVFAVGLLVFLGAACLPPKTEKPTDAKTASWKNIGANVDRYECSADVCGSRLIVYRFAKDAFNWRFEHRNAPSTVESWAKSLPQAVFVANGVFFDKNWQPTGRLIIKGKTLNDREYDLSKSGLLELAPEVRAIDTAKDNPNTSKITEAGQSFPLIIKNGSPVTTFKDEHGARRTMIGTDTDGNIYIIAIPEDAVTFVKAAQLLMRIGVKWMNVLNLDGGTSTGFAARLGNWSETMNSIVQVPNVIVVEKK